MKVVIIDDAQINVTLLQHLVRKLPDLVDDACVLSKP